MPVSVLCISTRSHRISLYRANVTRNRSRLYRCECTRRKREGTRETECAHIRTNIQRDRERERERIICGKIPLEGEGGGGRGENKRCRGAGLFGIKRRDVEGDGGEAVRALLQRRQHRAVTNCVVLHVYIRTHYTHRTIASQHPTPRAARVNTYTSSQPRRGGGAPCGMQSKTAGDRASCGGLPVKEGFAGARFIYVIFRTVAMLRNSRMTEKKDCRYTPCASDNSLFLHEKISLNLRNLPNKTYGS